MNYRCDNDKILVSISKGEFVNQSILDVAKINGVDFGWINGLGAIIDPELGYYDIQNKKYCSVNCTTCSYTEFYKEQRSAAPGNVFDFFTN